ncbi:hypothetical protein BAJUN_01710 [Bajunvirus bajun]|uniref:Uncharacterized protein n=1 Tax=Brevundimonas phage vB_BgoS-Bajun TaxID=2948594 RepID=A0A9E7N4L4_9CAUD|nr:hypothetical protein BAJUN_01710 [Brevundimonas phage vB_BgoS-Bajun]
MSKITIEEIESWTAEVERPRQTLEVIFQTLGYDNGTKRVDAYVIVKRPGGYGREAGVARVVHASGCYTYGLALMSLERQMRAARFAPAAQALVEGFAAQARRQGMDRTEFPKSVTLIPTER